MSSLYIHSLLYGILIYQKPFLVSKKENRWDILDGKQRGTTLIKYINNEFALCGLQNEPKIIIDGEEYNINGKVFKRLPDELQMMILDFAMDLAVLEEATIKEESLFFNRSNSGMAMTTLDMARSKNNDIETVKEIGKHDIFDIMFTKKMLVKLPQDEIVVKSWIALYSDMPNYSSTYLEQVSRDLIITDEAKSEILARYDLIFEACKIVSMYTDKIFVMGILKKSHFLTYFKYVDMFTSAKQLSEWLLEFYQNQTEEYIETTNKGTGSPTVIQKRLAIIKKSVEDFLDKV